ncbi:glycoside hydrolase family 6 protein [Catenuloplanes atrovinosus]|uniref:Glucanase n=1 Tax=Catenuloplanes atrovinosus TaxID=137266 RepID=A0AAE4CCP4_9ACTN|nr:glycoside hydrolase family 6 protein [Catenuloplanes atrovinosus]MDR7278204.1 endoglucanase [Catenuloplanes atrovinosus]
MRRIAAGLLAAALLGPAACTPADDPAPPVNPLAGVSFFVSAPNVATRQADAYAAGGRAEDAAAIRHIGEQPTAVWFTGAAPDTATRAATLVADARAAGRMPVIAVYHIPGRDCGSFSAGGASGADEYRAWIGALAGALAGEPVLIVLEPDAVAQAVDGCAGPPAERYALLAAAVGAFAANPRAHVYLDAGNASWIADHARLADALRAAGIDRAAGFALNVSNFETTEASVAYGTRLSEALGGAHFVIDTSRNGNGPHRATGVARWCNPPGRAIGASPTTDTGVPRLDALLWVKRPGESDGECDRGDPPAGAWFPEYALSLSGR